MPLDLPDGVACLVDANIFYYALVPTAGVTPHCLQLLDRAIAGRIAIFTSVPALSDAIHKVMISEVAELSGRDRAGIVGYLGRHPEIITRLVEYPQALPRLLTVPMNVLPVDDRLLLDAVSIGIRYGLLTNDAMIVALMQRQQLTHLVTNDDDFDRIPMITVWKPR